MVLIIYSQHFSINTMLLKKLIRVEGLQVNRKLDISSDPIKLLQLLARMYSFGLDSCLKICTFLPYFNQEVFARFY